MIHVHAFGPSRFPIVQAAGRRSASAGAKAALGAVLCGACVTAIACTPPDEEASTERFHLESAPETRALITYRGPSGEHWTTTGALQPQYRSVRDNGWVLGPSAPRPPDTLELWSWIDSTRGPVTAATQPPPWGSSRWREGFIFEKPVAGTVALGRWQRPDNGQWLTTSDPEWWLDSARPRMKLGYQSWFHEGYVLAPRDDDALQRSAAFGGGSMTVNGVPAINTRALLLVLATDPEYTWEGGLGSEAYRQVIFGQEAGAGHDLVSYFREVSQGLFTWEYAGTSEVTVSAGHESQEAFLADVKSKLTLEHIELERFDYDHNGLVTSDELGILVIDNRQWIGAFGARSDPNCVRPERSSVALCSDAALVGLAASFTSMGSGLMQLLGAYPVHQAAYRTTVMTQHPSAMSAYRRETVYPDPWHRIQLGWTLPRVRSLRHPGRVETIALPDRGASSPASQPVLLYDPSRGTDEFFIIEYRSTIAGGRVFDADGPGQGVLVWRVRQKPDHSPATDWVAGIYQRAVTTVAREGIGGGDLWTGEDGDFTLSWSDGRPVGIKLHVGMVPADDTRTQVEWSSLGQPFTPRLDWAGPVRPGERLTVGGMLGVVARGRPVLRAGADTIPLSPSHWSSSTAQLTSPVALRPGVRYELTFPDAEGSGTSNRLFVEVRP